MHEGDSEEEQHEDMEREGNASTDIDGESEETGLTQDNDKAGSLMEIAEDLQTELEKPKEQERVSEEGSVDKDSEIINDSSAMGISVKRRRTKTMYARAVWVEHGKEVEGTAPDNWIDVEKKVIRWPKKGEKAAIINRHSPQDDWMTFTLVKRKMTSVSIRDCDEYDLTSHVEEEDEEDEEEVRRKKTKRNFDDYVLESDYLEEDEDNITDAVIKVPPFPIPPAKVTKCFQMESAGFNKKLTDSGHSNLERSQQTDTGHLHVKQASQLKGAGSSHKSSHNKISQQSEGSPCSSGSQHRKRYRHRKQSRHHVRSKDSNQMEQDVEIDQTGHRREISDGDFRGFPMDMAKFQKKVLSKLIDIHTEVRRLGRSEPPRSSAHIVQLETMEDFEREEERLKDKQAFESLALYQPVDGKFQHEGEGEETETGSGED
ncbi:hypothetical protein Q8A67_007248 [Cirrhinus molitorella]|uniref:Uncharacterized protein n=1 Tax=Cirrhinus molitorella TaxID=172907 RepID=A0AA88Q364_9TELE|nr:hypothetical protein Q8A67_007248 [Cirrhinus molitorella]